MATANHPSLLIAADAIFAGALEEAPENRAAFVAAACGEQGDIRSLVERLLAANETSSPLDRPLASDLVPTLGGGHRPARLTAGSRIGPWRLVSELGRGGMGIVWRAERADGVYLQQAALKVFSGSLEDGASSAALIERFAQERQILATLSDPRISRLLDGGVTAEGRPYLAMELVDGVPIDGYCDQNHLGLLTRVQLAEEVARAVHIAHRSLVVHRDLKPSNILVTTNPANSGETGASRHQVKLLDFGIAKVLAPGSLPLVSPETQTLMRVLTPRYASPEQVRGEPITTASDVYQLGVLLHELVTGQAAVAIADASFQALERAVCTGELERASRAVLAAGPAAASMRSSTPRRLAGLVRGDLETILAVATRKDPARRYASAEALADDLRRYRERLPIAARPDSMAYRARMLVSRRPWGVAAGVAFVLLIVAYLVTLTLQSERVARERDRAQLEARRAERVSELLVGMFEEANPEQAGRADVTARQILDRGAARIESQLASEPELAARLQFVLGKSYASLGATDAAEAALRAAQATLDRLPQPDPELAVNLPLHLARIRCSLGDFAECRTFGARARELAERLLPNGHPSFCHLATDHAWLAWQTGQADGETLARAAVAVCRSLRTTMPDSYSSSLSTLGNILRDGGQLAEAEKAFDEMLAVDVATHGADSPRIAIALSNLAFVVEQRGDLVRAEGLTRRALELKQRLYGAEHPSTGVTLHNLARLLGREGRFVESTAIGEQALAVRRRARGPLSPDVALTLVNLASVDLDRGQLARAETRLREALAIDRSISGSPHHQLGSDLVQQSRLEELRGQHEPAIASATEALAILDRTPAGQARRDAALIALGAARVARGDLVGAEPLLREALALRRERLISGDHRISEAELNLAACLLLSNRLPEGGELLDRSLGLLASFPFRLSPTVAQRLVRALDHQGDHQRAAQVRELLTNQVAR